MKQTASHERHSSTSCEVKSHTRLLYPHNAISIHQRPVRIHFVRNKLLHVNGIHPRPVGQIAYATTRTTRSVKISIHQRPVRTHFVRNKLLHVNGIHPRPVRSNRIRDNPHNVISIHQRPARTHFVRSKLLHIFLVHGGRPGGYATSHAM